MINELNKGRENETDDYGDIIGKETNFKKPDGSIEKVVFDTLCVQKGIEMRLASGKPAPTTGLKYLLNMRGLNTGNYVLFGEDKNFVSLVDYLIKSVREGLIISKECTKFEGLF